MPKKASKSVLKFRSALGDFLKLKLDYRLNRGELDQMIEQFLSGDFQGDTFTISQTATLLVNDVILMNLLLDNPLTTELKRKLYRLWDEENGHPLSHICPAQKFDKMDKDFNY